MVGEGQAERECMEGEGTTPRKTEGKRNAKSEDRLVFGENRETNGASAGSIGQCQGVRKISGNRG